MMKRIIILLLCFSMLLTGCSQGVSCTVSGAEESPSNEEPKVEVAISESSKNLIPDFDGLSDEALLTYIEDSVYQNTITELNSEEYVVEAVNATYISKEYLEELTYNSQPNIYFGYTLDELNNIFQGTRYVFALGEDGQTFLQELEEITNTDSETILKNVAIGSGVILFSVTVSTVAPAVGAPAAVTAIFAASANTAEALALSFGMFGGISAAIVSGYQTGDWREALQAFAKGGSEGFKWGAIIGAITGGADKAIILKEGTKSGLTMSEVAMIQKESSLPIDVISQIHSMDEYLVYREAGLKTMLVNGRTALVPDIDLNYVSELPDGTSVTNLVRMQKGYAPIDPVTEKTYQLHHIGQKADGTLAVLTETQHQGNSAILNILGKESEIDRAGFSKVRKAFWEYMGNVIFA